MGRKRKVYHSLRNIINRKDDTDIVVLTNILIKNLHKDKDPYLRQCGNALQSIRNYWIMKCESLEQRNFNDWNELSNKLDNEVDKMNKFKQTAEELSIYKPYYKEYDNIYKKHMGMSIHELLLEHKKRRKDISLLWKHSNSNLTEEELKLLRDYKFNTFSREAAFNILIMRNRNNEDFPFQINIKDKDSLSDGFKKFIKQFDKRPIKITSPHLKKSNPRGRGLQ